MKKNQEHHVPVLPHLPAPPACRVRPHTGRRRCLGLPCPCHSRSRPRAA
jgi:hypothetical protein